MLVTKSSILMELGSSESLHPLPECSTDALQSAHVIAQVLKFVFRTECSSRLNHLSRDVIERVEIAVEIERSCDVLGRITELRDQLWQSRLQVTTNRFHVALNVAFHSRLSLGASVGTVVTYPRSRWT